MPAVEERIVALDEILEPWQPRLGNDFAGHRNHVYRVVNFCFAMVATADNTIGTANVRFMAERACPSSNIVEVNASHVVMISQPDKVADLILTAARGMPAVTTHGRWPPTDPTPRLRTRQQRLVTR